MPYVPVGVATHGRFDKHAWLATEYGQLHQFEGSDPPFFVANYQTDYFAFTYDANNIGGATFIQPTMRKSTPDRITRCAFRTKKWHVTSPSWTSAAYQSSDGGAPPVITPIPAVTQPAFDKTFRSGKVHTLEGSLQTYLDYFEPFDNESHVFGQGGFDIMRGPEFLEVEPIDVIPLDPSLTDLFPIGCIFRFHKALGPNGFYYRVETFGMAGDGGDPPSTYYHGGLYGIFSYAPLIEDANPNKFKLRVQVNPWQEYGQVPTDTGITITVQPQGLEIVPDGTNFPPGFYDCTFEAIEFWPYSGIYDSAGAQLIPLP